jgi:hypothetical protein
VHQRVIAAIERVEFVTDIMSYVILRGRWCHIIVLDLHSPTDDKIKLAKHASASNLKVFSTISLNIIRNLCLEI